MLPRPSVCLNIPKTGSTNTVWFFGAADWLHLKRACSLRRLGVPNRASLRALNRIKRLGLAYGNLNGHLPVHHAAYSTLPAGLRGYPKIATLRDVESWYCSHYLYYTRSMRHTMLSRAIRLLIHDDDRRLEPALRAFLLRRRHAFVRRFEAEHDGSTSAEDVSVEFLVWFMHNVRAEYNLRRWVGMDAFPARIGYLTFRAIVLLFEDPARVLRLPPDELEEYFASGRYRRDLRCDFLLSFAALTDELCVLMTGELGYSQDIVLFLKERAGRKNVSRRELKPPVMHALRHRGLIGRIRRRERIYERYLLPLAVDRP